MVLGHSLRDTGAKGKLVVLAVLDNLSGDAVTELKVIAATRRICQKQEVLMVSDRVR